MPGLRLITIVYLIMMNMFGGAAMALDKKRARRNEWRIPERTLFLLAAFGGSIGMLVGMYLFHHKTRRWYFVIGIPLILLIQTAIITVLYIYGIL